MDLYNLFGIVLAVRKKGVFDITAKRENHGARRLSQEDKLAGESGSIQRQKQILKEYAEKNGFPNPRVWADDGFSGVSFDRPGYNEMIAEVDAGNVSTIIVKNHSRLGRNRLIMGYLIEEKFPDYGVRYIAINDSVDTDRGNKSRFSEHG